MEEAHRRFFSWTVPLRKLPLPPTVQGLAAEEAPESTRRRSFTRSIRQEPGVWTSKSQIRLRILALRPSTELRHHLLRPTPSTMGPNGRLARSICPRKIRWRNRAYSHLLLHIQHHNYSPQPTHGLLQHLCS